MSEHEEFVHLNKKQIKFYDQIYSLNNEDTETIRVIYLEKEWGKDKNLIGYFKLVDQDQVFKLNIFRDLTTDMYGIGEDLKNIPFGTLLLIEIKKDVGKDNLVYTRVMFLLSLKHTWDKREYVLE